MKNLTKEQKAMYKEIRKATPQEPHDLPEEARMGAWLIAEQAACTPTTGSRTREDRVMIVYSAICSIARRNTAKKI